MAVGFSADGIPENGIHHAAFNEFKRLPCNEFNRRVIAVLESQSFNPTPALPPAFRYESTNIELCGIPQKPS